MVVHVSSKHKVPGSKPRGGHTFSLYGERIFNCLMITTKMSAYITGATKCTILVLLGSIPNILSGSCNANLPLNENNKPSTAPTSAAVCIVFPSCTFTIFAKP